MMKFLRHLLLFSLVFSQLHALSQKNGSVKGVVMDTIAKQPVAAATITVLQRKDSSLVTFTMTNSSGAFSLSGVEPGDYRLLVTHTNYHNGNKYFSINDSLKHVDLGDVVLNDKDKVLEEVVIRAEAPPVTLIGDTIQYNAESFKTKPNAVVEDLLKKLPGIQVEKDGTVKAQGQTVNRVLVDGKEFFGNDPKVATKNLPADAVDKVQVFDKPSDIAQLTGFDDGNSEKTINLKLKQDKKKGLFGKISAGGGTEGRYQGRFNVNSFKGARQFSALGLGNNTNAEGFSFMDMLSFTGAASQMGRGGQINFSMSGDDPLAAMMGGNNNNAINTSWAGGINYNNIIGKKMELNGNYFYSRYNPVTANTIHRQYILPDSTYFYDQSSRSNTRSITNRTNFTYDFVIDSLHSLKVTPNFSYQSSVNSSKSTYRTLSEEMRQTNSGFSESNIASEGYNFSNNILFRKKFNRRGRTLSINLGMNLSKSDGDGILQSVNEFVLRSGAILTDSINQKNQNGSEGKSYNARAVYTEPIFKRSLIELSVGKSGNFSRSEKKTYDLDPGSGKYDIPNDLLTNDFENTYGTHTAGVRVRTQKKRYNFALGLTWQNAELEGKIKSGIKDSALNKSFYNLLPNGRLEYNFTKFKTLRINYQTSTNQPTVSQLQPVPDVSNTLNIRNGNPDLKQEYIHRFNASYAGVDPFRSKNLFLYTSFMHTDNKIANYDQIDSLGRKTTTPVNVNGVYQLTGDVSVGVPLKFIKATMSINTGITLSRSFQYINTAKNEIRNFRIDPDIQLMKSFKDKVDITLSAGLNMYRAKYSIQSALNTKYLTQEYGLDLGMQLPAKFYLSTEMNYLITSDRAVGFNQDVPLWNASISKLFMKFNRGEIKLSCFDLLNQNKGISRNTNANYIEDQVSTVLDRFFLLSFTYSLNKMGANDGGGRGNIIIRR